MTTQCSHEILESALSGDLPPEREECLQRHLDECQACSAALHQLAGGDAWRRETAAMLTTDELDTALHARDEWSSVDFTVEHLEPADEPDVLGRLGGYDVLEIIGHGGMGVVLKAFDHELKRCVAIKVLSPHLAQSSLARKRFTREAQAAAAVVHPNVMAIHNVQPNGPLPFLIMPLVAGESLAQRLAARGRLELKETLRVGTQAAAALAAAHEQGLVHRDVKPANILLETGVERAVLTDFGLARAADDVSMTRWGIISGTPQYMSPEQAGGEVLDGRSDLFSLGCVLYEMATGVSPFRADSMMATLRRLIDDSPQAMSSLNSELPPWFVGTVERLLEKDPSRRFASAKEVSDLLEGCLAHLQQPTSVPLPKVLISLREMQTSTPNKVGKTNGMLRSEISKLGISALRLLRRKPSITGAIAMLTLLGVCLFAVGVVETSPPEISGRWSGEDWGQVELVPAAAGEYTGTFSDTVTKQPGKIKLRWSRIERRFNGTWSEGEERFGELSVRLVDHEIRGAMKTDPASKTNPGTPQLADLLWTRGGQHVAVVMTTTPNPASQFPRMEPQALQAGPNNPVVVYDPTVASNQTPKPGTAYVIVGPPNTLQTTKPEPSPYMPSPSYSVPQQAVPYPVIPPSTVRVVPRLLSIKKFTTADNVLSGSLAAKDGNWTADVKSLETLRLFEVENPKLEGCKVFYRAKLKTENFKGQVYLEMWCRLPGKGEFFSRGLDNALSGSTGWISCETPFMLEPGQRPDLIRLNVVAKGEGTVQVKDVELLESSAVDAPGFVYMRTQVGVSSPQSSNPHVVPADQPVATAHEAFLQWLAPVNSPNLNGEAARRIQSQNNMRQISVAVFNYEAAFGKLPPAYIADEKTGKPLLSWRVAILPFLEQDALYRQFHLDEPWDSDHNKKLADTVVADYRSPASKAKPGMTNYLTLRGKDTVFPGKEGVKISDVTDGTSNTIMLVEADDAKAVPWTKPDDLPYDEKNPSAGLGGLFSGGFNAVFCDCSARFLSTSIDAESLRRLFNRHDGEPVDWEHIRTNGRPQVR